MEYRRISKAFAPHSLLMCDERMMNLLNLGNTFQSQIQNVLFPHVPPNTTSAGLALEEEAKHLHIRMQKWLDIISENPILIHDEELYSPVVQKDKPASGLKRKAIKMQGPPPDDTPELSSLRPIVKKFHQQTSESSAKLEKVIKALRNISVSEDELGLKFAAIADMEHHSGMANAFRKLGKNSTKLSVIRI
ncbi:unnamed protein product [Pneumocystis jirovecii]|uniref:Uncharacterized protein n=1 Tax=Pneumocystis jirovecii TaxID=42068 RepID=L0PGI0_PNEJI|nr:unnamed protein product [Pneumocystis jirovecii]